MATFEPQVPRENPGVYEFWARPAEQPIADKSKEVSLKALGRGIDEGARAGVQLQDMNIENQAARGTDKILDEWQSRLQPVYDAVTGQKKDLDVLSPQSMATQTPANLQKGLQSLDKIDAVMASGKYSPLYPQTQATELLKRLRSIYPSFRQEIDEKVNRLWGRGIANRSIETMQNVINSYVAKKDELTTDTMKALRKEVAAGNTDLVPTLVAFKGGLINAEEATLAMGLANHQDYQLKHLELQRNATRAAIEDRTMIAKRQADQKVANDQYWFVHNMPINFFGAKHIDELPAIMNSPNISQTQRTAIAQAITRYGQEWEQRINGYLDRRNIRTKKSLRDDLGEYDPVANARGFFSQQAKYVNNKETGPMVTTAKTIEAKVQDTENIMYSEPFIGAALMARHVINKIAPQSEYGKQIDEEMQRMGVVRAFAPFIHGLNNMLRAGVSPSATDVTTTGGRWDFDAFSPLSKTPTRGAPSFQRNIEETSDAMKKTNASEATTSKAIAAVINPVHEIADTQTPEPVRHNLFTGLVGLAFNIFGQDHKDANGNPILGSSSIYAIMTTPAIDKYVFTNKNITTEERQKYVNWKVGEFVHTVFTKELGDLDSVVSGPNADKVKVGYDTEHNKILVEPRAGTSGLFGEAEIRKAQEAAYRLNLGFANLASMTKYTKQDPNEFIAQVLSQNHGPFVEQLLKTLQAQQQSQRDVDIPR